MIWYQRRGNNSQNLVSRAGALRPIFKHDNEQSYRRARNADDVQAAQRVEWLDETLARVGGLARAIWLRG